MLEASCIACDAEGKPVEIVFHLYFEKGSWQLAINPAMKILKSGDR